MKIMKPVPLPDHSPDPCGAETADTPVPSDTNPSGSKLLIVDDDANIVEVLGIQLSTVGATVVSATNGYDALTVAALEMPDVIITDYMMPTGSGDYFISRLKADPVLKDIPVIVLTGRTFEGAEDVALKRDLVGRGGAVAFLTKPVGEDALIAELRKHVALSDT